MVKVITKIRLLKQTEFACFYRQREHIFGEMASKCFVWVSISTYAQFSQSQLQRSSFLGGGGRYLQIYGVIRKSNNKYPEIWKKICPQLKFD